MGNNHVKSELQELTDDLQGDQARHVLFESWSQHGVELLQAVPSLHLSPCYIEDSQLRESASAEKEDESL
ncbi:hypothetical protein D3P07_04690 [Paenibacillus sp. 1011MAR3C5]|uniref:hypothetical protein n=1 Tax=Paenibacillus sp. 1011MAR3C5 TaxID=1675787 RepID=UPI000E6C15DC|nr:hypothetical protein [Paenibacillus sp. 1011MAR3C5]RJE91352.1 hypothetical protein D3P07_04690 [Paenibacillus sp. 1011MAR3C5]